MNIHERIKQRQKSYRDTFYAKLKKDPERLAAYKEKVRLRNLKAKQRAFLKITTNHP